MCSKIHDKPVRLSKQNQHKPYISFTFSLCSDLWPRSASGVDDAVGEVSMTVEIFSDPSTGGHKITVKGASVGQICSMSLIISARISLIVLLSLSMCDWQLWQPMTFAGRRRGFSGPSWRFTSSALTSVTRRGSSPPNPRTTAGPRSSANPSSCTCLTETDRILCWPSLCSSRYSLLMIDYKYFIHLNFFNYFFLCQILQFIRN